MSYRYRLSRVWDETLPALCWVMLNPSTATATVDDPTIRRVVGFSRSWGFGSAEVVNLFALRSQHPGQIRHAADPVGPDNDEATLTAAAATNRVLAAWGNHGAVPNPGTGQPRCDEVTALLDRAGAEVLTLGTTKAGQPRHPLYLPAVTVLVEA